MNKNSVLPHDTAKLQQNVSAGIREVTRMMRESLNNLPQHCQNSVESCLNEVAGFQTLLVKAAHKVESSAATQEPSKISL